MRQEYDFLIVGAGLSGAVLAERLSNRLNKRCLVIDRRSHMAGNAYDHYDDAGVLIHRYGPHYFRTNSRRVVDYLSRFTDWHHVEYKILSWTNGRYWNFPINLNTFEQLLGRPSSSEEMQATLQQWRIPISNPCNSEELIISQVGWTLYEMFYKNYTRKHWRREPKDLDPNVCGRIPIRTNRDDRFLSERFQALPKDGYSTMISRMLANPKIEVSLNTSFAEARHNVRWKHLIWSGPIDEYFDYRFGPLPYRSLRFEPETLPRKFFQPAMQVNYPNDHDFTRIVEIKHATGQKIAATTIIREYPEDYCPGKEAYYPIPAPDALAQYRRYADLVAGETEVSFIGRLATYRYLNMDQVVSLALAKFDRFCKRGELVMT